MDDQKKRMDDFRAEYIELTKKYQVDFASYPQYIQIQQGVFSTIIQTELVDKANLPIPSPIITDAQ